MDRIEMEQLLSAMNYSDDIVDVTQCCREEDGSAYDVWIINGKSGAAVLKKVSKEELTIYERFLHGLEAAAKIYGFCEIEGQDYMLMEHISGETLSNCTRQKLVHALNALIQIQDAFWEDRDSANIGWTFEMRYAAREKRVPYMGEFDQVYRDYLLADRSVPRTLCNDDLLPFNVIVNEHRAVIIDWEYAGILPYPCCLARLLAFGEEDTDFMFQMSEADKEFAVQYYYEHLVAGKGISWDEYIRTMKLFFFKEYSEWVYYARSNDDYSKAEYHKYYGKCRKLAADLGYLIETN